MSVQPAMRPDDSSDVTLHDETLTYVIGDALYINLTNRCNLACIFCPRFSHYTVRGHKLKLRAEPSADDILATIGDPSRYEEIVFCGYGEPTLRLETLLAIAHSIKQCAPGTLLRLNTNGLGNLTHKRNILPELSLYIDRLSVSLNAPDATTYARLCPSKYRESAYEAVKQFIKDARPYIPEVTASVVGFTGVDRETCRQVVEEELGVRFRYREYNDL